MSDKYQNLSFEIKDSHSISDISFIKEKLIEYNNECLNLPLDTPGPQPVSVMVKNKNDEKIAGAYAHAYLNVLHIYGCWVHKDYRKKGIGKEIGKKLEKLAEKYKCHTATMETHSFQMTKSFYKRVGVLFINRVKNSPNGHSKYFLINKLQHDKNFLWKFINKIQTYILK
jgi:ribosomal protein S18 acetylase RimI-like enzyme